MTETATRPRLEGDLTAAFAYLRRLPDMDDAAMREAVTALLTFSIDRGFSLVGIHYEERPGERLDTWMALITSCRSEDVANVLMLSAEHFHHDPVIATYMREELAEKICGTVWLASEAAANQPQIGSRGRRP